MDQGRQVALQLGLFESLLSHVDYTTDAVTGFHVLEGSVDLGQWLSVGDKLVDLQLAIHIVGHEIGELCSTLNASKSAPLPHATCDELESWRYESAWYHMFVIGLLTSCRNLLPCRSDANDNALAPSFVTSF